MLSYELSFPFFFFFNLKKKILFYKYSKKVSDLFDRSAVIYKNGNIKGGKNLSASRMPLFGHGVSLRVSSLPAKCQR